MPSSRERRERHERRNQTLSFWHLRRLHGRRSFNRRAEEDDALYFVERIPAPIFLLSILLLVFTIVDGLITIILLDYGFEEANPVMRVLLKAGPGVFFLGKFVLTAIFLPVTLVMHRYRLFRSRFRVGHLIPLVACLYVVLILYQIHLWNQRFQTYPGMSAAIDIEAEGSLIF